MRARTEAEGRNELLVRMQFSGPVAELEFQAYPKRATGSHSMEGRQMLWSIEIFSSDNMDGARKTTTKEGHLENNLVPLLNYVEGCGNLISWRSTTTYVNDQACSTLWSKS